MPDFNPNDMDALFREGAERHEFEYNPDAWALMEEKLDKKSRKKRIVFYLLGLGLLILTFVSYSYLSSNKDDIQTEIVAGSESLGAEQKEALAEPSEIKVQETLHESNNTNIQTILSKAYKSTESKERNSNIGAQRIFQRDITDNLLENEIISIPSPSQNVNDHQSIQTETTSLKEIGGIIGENIMTDEPNSKIQDVVIPIIDKIEFQLKHDEVLPIKALDFKFSQSSNQPALPNYTKSRFAAALFANPEWSSVGLFRESKAGWSFGAKVGYQFANKFEVSAGIAYSRKIYKGGGESYTMDGGWFDDIEPMRMDAKCDVIEIPIGLSYYINGYRNSGFFTDLGINSYMLHSEWYGFEYNDALVRPPGFTEVIEEAQNTHLIGVGRLAIGYQKVLSNKTSFQVAPYLQFPLTGIGAGQVNVYSTGVQIAVKFNTQ